MPRLNTRQRTERAEVALRELELHVTTNADKVRCARVADGFRALDDEQAAFKLAVADLCDEYENPNAPSDDCARLLGELRKLLTPKARWRKKT